MRLWLKLVVKPQLEYEFFAFQVEGRRIVILETAAAYRQPVTFRGNAYVRVGSALTELSKEPRIAETIYRTIGHDWSSEILRGETLDSLDREALDYARQEFAKKHKGERCVEEMDAWDDVTFLNKARLVPRIVLKNIWMRRVTTIRFTCRRCWSSYVSRAVPRVLKSMV